VVKMVRLLAERKGRFEVERPFLLTDDKSGYSRRAVVGRVLNLSKRAFLRRIDLEGGLGGKDVVALP